MRTRKFVFSEYCIYLWIKVLQIQGIMATITYSLGKVPDSAGECEIGLRVYVTRDIRLRLRSGIWVPSKRWGKKNGITIPTVPGEEQETLITKKEALKNLSRFIEDEIKLADDKTLIDKAWGEQKIREFYKPKKEKADDPTNFFKLIEQYKTERRFSEYRLKHLSVIVRCLKRFELYKRAEGKTTFRLNIHKMTPALLIELEDFLASEPEVFKKHPAIYTAVPYSVKESKKTYRPEKKKTAKGEDAENPRGMPKVRGKNTIIDQMNRIRSFMIWASKKDIIKYNPFNDYEIDEPVYGKPIYITVEERNTLYKTDLSDDPVLAQQRDIFVFQCLIGCRVGDLYRLTPQNIIAGGLEYIPGKTNNERATAVRVPLTKTAQEIVNRYHDPGRKELFPFITEQQYNIHIKQAFRRAGLTRMVTVVDQVTREAKQERLCDIASTHMARRTFIGNIYKQVADPSLIGVMSGHKEGSKAFARYRDIDEDMKRKTVSLLE